MKIISFADMGQNCAHFFRIVFLNVLFARKLAKHRQCVHREILIQLKTIDKKDYMHKGGFPNRFACNAEKAATKIYRNSANPNPKTFKVIVGQNKFQTRDAVVNDQLNLPLILQHFRTWLAEKASNRKDGQIGWEPKHTRMYQANGFQWIGFWLSESELQSCTFRALREWLAARAER